ncbi:MAG: thioesterase domain-containing protein [Cellvibrionaceae bacterium]
MVKCANVVLLNGAEIEEEVKPPLFLLCGIELYQYLAKQITDRKVYGVFVASELAIIKYAMEGKKCDIPFEKLCQQYVDSILKVQHEGPYEFGGLSFGGYIAVQVAKKMRDLNLLVDQVYLFDTMLPSAKKGRSNILFIKNIFTCPGDVSNKIFQKIKNIYSDFQGKKYGSLPQLKNKISHSWDLRKNAFYSIMKNNESSQEPYDGKVVLFKASGHRFPEWIIVDESLGWKKLIPNFLEIISVPGDHRSILNKENVKNISNVINKKE